MISHPTQAHAMKTSNSEFDESERFGVPTLGCPKPPNTLKARHLLVVVAVLFAAPPALLRAAAPLQEFAYRELTVRVCQADGRPAAGIPLYGFCRELNLVWPRHDAEWQGRNDIVWTEAYLARTGADGRVKVTVPPGRWGFCAAGRVPGGLVVAWTEFRERAAGEIVSLVPKTSKRWTLSTPEGAALVSSRLFFKAEQLPIWLPVVPDPLGDGIQVQMTPGTLHLWACGAASSRQPAFALSFGAVTDATPDGPLAAAGPVSTIQCRGGSGRAVLLWERHPGLGLEGEIKVTDPAQVLVAPGPFTLAYRRPLPSGLTGRFVGHRYDLATNGLLSLNFDGGLTAGLDHDLEKPDKAGQHKLAARLYLLDTNGHLLAEAAYSSGVPAPFRASVVVAGRRIPVQPSEKGIVPGQGEGGQTFFEAGVGTITNADGAVWEIAAPVGLLAQARFPESEMATIKTSSYTATAPRALEPHARNCLDQMEVLARQMEALTGRKRGRHTMLYVKPGRSGAYATHGGGALGIGSKFFYSDDVIARHDTVHETGHNFNFFHGGLHETVVEIIWCLGSEQVSQQPAKWMFLDRMNGLTRKEVMYPNTGLYLYGYAQGGEAFLRFMVANDKPVGDKVAAAGFSKDEATAACLSLALHRDMTQVCAAYGLKVTTERVASATAAARGLVK
jgi:hypothetical protein